MEELREITKQIASQFRGRGKPLTAGQQRFEQSINTSLALVRTHQSLELQDKAREIIPIERLHAQAQGDDFYMNLLRCTLDWFKTECFTWVDAVPCIRCSNKTQATGMATPTAEDVRYGAHRVETHTCQTCGFQNRFPRYNDPQRLLETRRGRCGEWANVFCLITRTLGFETRYILDFTDHVWTEVFVNDRWVSMDSCEGSQSLDTPLMYETGWGKKLNYILAFGDTEVEDVTHKYTLKLSQLERSLVPEAWLSARLLLETNRLRDSLSVEERARLDVRDLKVDMPTVTGSERGRQSGALQWRLDRNETK
ncbi:hypothetical protein EDD86DRAFT_110257 [Gorgonomyces haynaldii]|nr:hypothetical protein EDD86DRAFT_110257 [Gorgonomyces haynaldii]